MKCPKCGTEMRDKIVGDVCPSCDYVKELEE